MLECTSLVLLVRFRVNITKTRIHRGVSKKIICFPISYEKTAQDGKGTSNAYEEGGEFGPVDAVNPPSFSADPSAPAGPLPPPLTAGVQTKPAATLTSFTSRARSALPSRHLSTPDLTSVADAAGVSVGGVAVVLVSNGARGRVLVLVPG